MTRAILAALLISACSVAPATLQSVNTRVNADIAYTADADEVRDHCRSPMQTMRTGQGDCDDYACLKAWMLEQQGIRRADMRLALGYTGNGEGHAVLVVRVDGQEWWLDNRHDAVTFQPIDFKER